MSKTDISGKKKTEKVNITIKFCIFKLIQAPNLNFWTKFAQKGYFQSKMKKVNITIAF